MSTWKNFRELVSILVEVSVLCPEEVFQEVQVRILGLTFLQLRKFQGNKIFCFVYK